jgi:hypothetical protein
MIEIKAPEKVPVSDVPKIFLAGSIEMGLAHPWQEEIAQQLKDYNVVLINPRRDIWDSSWKQEKEHPEFRAQVEWELNGLSTADYIVIYFDPETKSPVSLLELGLHADGGNMFVVCPDGFWRKGNVDIVCERYMIPQFGNVNEVVDHIKTLLK